MNIQNTEEWHPCFNRFRKFSLLINRKKKKIIANLWKFYKKKKSNIIFIYKFYIYIYTYICIYKRNFSFFFYNIERENKICHSIANLTMLHYVPTMIHIFNLGDNLICDSLISWAHIITLSFCNLWPYYSLSLVL